jgi:hypothetical protein
MLQPWMGARMAAEHRRDLTPSRARTLAGESLDELSELGASRRLNIVEQRSAPASHLARRPIGQQLGALLIRAGTRLGGASMRTS